MQLAHSTPTPKSWHRQCIMQNPDGQQVLITECREKIRTTSVSGNIVYVSVRKTPQSDGEARVNFFETISGLAGMGYEVVGYSGRWVNQ